MLTTLSWLGRLSWPVLGSLVPGLSPRLLMWLAGALAVLVAVGGPAGAVWLHMNAKADGVAALERAACELRIADDSRVAAQALAELLGTIRAGEEATAEPKTAAEEAALCAKSPFCRKVKR